MSACQSYLKATQICTLKSWPGAIGSQVYLLDTDITNLIDKIVFAGGDSPASFSFSERTDSMVIFKPSNIASLDQDF